MLDFRTPRTDSTLQGVHLFSAAAQSDMTKTNPLNLTKLNADSYSLLSLAETNRGSPGKWMVGGILSLFSRGLLLVSGGVTATSSMT